MNVPEAAIEAAAEAVLKYDYGPRMQDADEYVRGGYRHAMSIALEAAMPGIREAIAQAVEASVAVTDHPDGSFSGTIYHAQYTHGIEDAARIVRGGTP